MAWDSKTDEQWLDEAECFLSDYRDEEAQECGLPPSWDEVFDYVTENADPELGFALFGENWESDWADRLMEAIKEVWEGQ